MVERIKSAAARQGITLSQLEQALGFGIRTIYKWDKNSPSVDKVAAVADFLHVSLSWLVTGVSEASSNYILSQFELLSDSDKEKIEHFMDVCLTDQHIARQAHVRNVPILGYASSRQHPGRIHCLGYAQTELEADYALIMGDSSMLPLFSPEEYVFLKNEKAFSDGDICVFYIHYRLECRQYRKNGAFFMLKPLNPSASAKEFAVNQPDQAEPIGRVVLSQRQKQLLNFFSSKI